MTLPDPAADPNAIDVPPDVAGASTTTTSIDVGTSAVTTTTVPTFPGSPSWLTGEFYTAIAPLAAAIGGLIAGHHLVPADVERELIGFGTVVAGVYALARTILKAVHVHAAATVARAQQIATAQAAAARPAPPASPPNVAALSAAVVDELDRRFVFTARRTPRKRPTR